MHAGSAHRLATRIKADINLCRKSPAVPSRVLKELRSHFATSLERRNLIYPPLLQQMGLTQDMSLDERRSALSIKPFDERETPETLKFKVMMEQQAQKGRQADWAWRIGRETYERDLENWYPFFVTLTVDPKRVPDPEKMWKDGKEWQKYIRRLSDVVTRTMGRRPARKDGVSTNQYVRYAGILEHGSSREHHHMHALIWMRDIPASWKLCPNRFVRDPNGRNRQRCLPLESYWPHADALRKPAKYFRFDGDIWSRHGFVMPIVKGKAIRSNPAEKAGAYLMKYTQKESKVWKHRVKATANIGLERLKALMYRIPLHELDYIKQRPPLFSQALTVRTIHNVPNGLMRSLATKISFYRKWATPSRELTELLEPNCESYTLMRESVRNGAKPWRMDLKELYAWVSQHLPENPEFSEHWFLDAHRSFMRDFPQLDQKAVTHLGGNKDEHSFCF